MQQEAKEEDRLEFREALALVLSSESFKHGNFIFDATSYHLKRGITFNDIKDLEQRLKRSDTIRNFTFINYKLGEKSSVEEKKAASGLESSELLDTYRVLDQAFSASRKGLQKQTKADALASLLQNLPELRHICLSLTYMDSDESLVILEALVKYQSRLRTLILDTNAINLKGVTSLARFLERPNCSLRYLQLQHCFISELRPKLYALIDALKNNHSLRKLDLTRCELDDDELEALSRMLAENKHLVTVQFSAKNPANESIATITTQLRKNREQQNALHSTLTDRTFLTTEACHAVIQDNDLYLAVLLGVPKKHEAESEEFETENKRLSKKLHEETIRLAILKSQQECIHKHLQNLAQTPTLAVTQDELDRSTSEVRKRFENEFAKSSAPASDQPKSRSELKVMDKVLDEYRQNTLDPLFIELKLVLTESTPMFSLKEELRDQVAKTEKYISVLKESQKQLNKNHTQYVEKRTHLLTVLKALSLSPALENEKEEISESLVEANIKPEDRATDGRTLLFTAFIHGKLKHFDTFLNSGADILATNNDGHSVFLELMKNYQLRPTYAAAKRHLEKTIREGVAFLSTHEQSLLDPYKELLIEDLSVFNIQSRATKVFASVSSEPSAISKDGPVLLSDSAPQLAGLNQLALALYHMIIILKSASQGKLTYLSNNQISHEVSTFLRQFAFENLKTFYFNIKNKGTMHYQSNPALRQAPAALASRPLGQPGTSLPVHVVSLEGEKGLAVKHLNGNGNHVKDSIPRNYSFMGETTTNTMLSYYVQLTQGVEESPDTSKPKFP